MISARALLISDAAKTAQIGSYILSQKPRYIQAVTGEGYLFVTPASE